MLNSSPSSPLADIYNFPLFNDRFCDEFVAQSESYGKWSNADKYGGLPNSDERLSGGYEPVPTQDIHFTQKGLDFAQTWYHILKWFVAPVAEQTWVGYTLDGARQRSTNSNTLLEFFAILLFPCPYTHTRARALSASFSVACPLCLSRA